MCAVLLAGASIQAQQGNKTSSPEDAAVYIVSPANGAVVPITFTVIFGLTGMGVAPAGIVKQGTGHHHLLVDGVVMPDLDMPLGAVVTHFGGGQTQTILTLPPGEHTLQLILGDHMHIPHEPPVISQVISIIVAN
ncbi:MAG: DUF4399 domain-containing protein [Gammaproteobacteria bacterium]|nr:DUF4399 domain-containing protein [Gammaproteobacteria bacterium]